MGLPLDCLKLPDSPKISVWMGDEEEMKRAVLGAQQVLVIYREKDSWKFVCMGGPATQVAVHAYHALAKLLEMEPNDTPVERKAEAIPSTMALKLPIPTEVPP
jgi:hypothetical protein